MCLLFIILDDVHMATDVKTIAIIAIGDICLMSEKSFSPYFQKSMDVLVQAGMVTTAPIDLNLPSEDVAHIHNLRQALIDAFMSIINGIKSPAEGHEPIMSNTVDDMTISSIRNMFFYLEKVMTLEDLQVNAELAKQILDLYCDIVILQMQDAASDPSNQSRVITEFSA